MKDTQYWKDYNQKRREYFQQRYQQQKVVKSEPVVKNESLQPQAILQPPKSLQPDQTSNILQPSLQPNQDMTMRQVVKSQSQILQPKLWANYYSCKKPFCSGCWQKGIPADQYAFCSLAKDTSDPDFSNIYFCQVYHWTVYQGKANQVL